MKNLLPDSLAFAFALNLIEKSSIKDTLIKMVDDEDAWWGVWASNHFEGQFVIRRSKEKWIDGTIHNNLVFDGEVEFLLKEMYGASIRLFTKDGNVTKAVATTCSGHYVVLEKNAKGNIAAVDTDDKLSFRFWEDAHLPFAKRKANRLRRINDGQWSKKPWNFDMEELVKKFSTADLLARPWSEQVRIAHRSDDFCKHFVRSDLMTEQIKKFISLFKTMRETQPLEWADRSWSAHLRSTDSLVNSIRNDKILEVAYYFCRDQILNQIAYLERHFKQVAVCNRKEVTPRCLRRRARKAAQQA